MSRGGRRIARLARRHERTQEVARLIREKIMPNLARIVASAAEAAISVMAVKILLERMANLDGAPPRAVAHAFVKVLGGRMPEPMEANERN